MRLFRFIPLFIALSAGLLQAGVDLALKSDAVVAGTSQGFVANGRVFSFYIQVDRVFQGDIAVGATVPVVLNSGRQMVIGDGNSVHHGIWFLKRSADGAWQVLPATTSGNVLDLAQLSLPMSNVPLPTALQYPIDAPVMDQLVLEVAAGVAANQEPYAGQPLAGSVLLNAIGRVNSSAAFQAYRYLASLAPSKIQMGGVAGLIRLNDTGGLLQAEAASTALTPGTWGPDNIILATGGFSSQDPQAIASLGHMATGQKVTPKLRIAALQALRSIHSAACLPWLAMLLSDSSPDIQGRAAQGLSFFANGVGVVTAESVPSMSFLNQRQKSSYHTADTEAHLGHGPTDAEAYVSYWASWWAQHPELHANN